VTQPRAADDFATIRARIEELRRERAQTLRKETRDLSDPTLGGRGLLKGTEVRARPEPERWPTGSSSRRHGTGR
jgi:hypothetical protein